MSKTKTYANRNVNNFSHVADPKTNQIIRRVTIQSRRQGFTLNVVWWDLGCLAFGELHVSVVGDPANRHISCFGELGSNVSRV